MHYLLCMFSFNAVIIHTPNPTSKNRTGPDICDAQVPNINIIDSSHNRFNHFLIIMFSVLAFAGAASAYNATTTTKSTAYVTIPCSSGQTLTYGSLTTTVSEATTLTVEDCSCTASAPSVAPTESSAPVLGNGAAAGPVAAVAGVAAAVAYLL